MLGKKQIIFTQYADTAQCLYNQIADGSDREGEIISRDISKILSIVAAQENTLTALLPCKVWVETKLP